MGIRNVYPINIQRYKFNVTVTYFLCSSDFALYLESISGLM